MSDIVFKGSQLKLTSKGMELNLKPSSLQEELRKSAGSKSFTSLDKLLEDVGKQLRDKK